MSGGASERRNDDAVAVEARVQAPVSVVTRESDVRPAALEAPACGDELAIRLDGQVEEVIVGARDRRDQATAASEARVESPVGQVSREGELGTRATPGDDLSVGLDYDCRGDVGATGLEGLRTLPPTPNVASRLPSSL